MKLQISLSCSQDPTTGLYPEPDESSPHRLTIYYNIHSSISYHLHLGLPTGLFPLGFPTKVLYAFIISTTHGTYLVRRILCGFITVYKVKITD